MKKPITSLLASILMIMASSASSQTFQDRVQIKIVDHDSTGSSQHLEIEIDGASLDTDVLIFVEFKGTLGLSMISDKYGEPYLAERGTSGRWVADFFVPQSPKAFYAIATNRSGYSTEWTKTRDLSALKRLGIEDRDSIEGVLSLLNEFGWTPTGYTFIGVSTLRGKGDFSSPSIANTSNICQTDAGSCPLVEFAAHGEKCFCNTPSGPVHGVIAPSGPVYDVIGPKP